MFIYVHTYMHTSQTHTHTPVKPGAQAQSSAASLPATELEFAGQFSQELAATALENLPASQSLHADDPNPVLCLPGVHATQGPPSEPVYPALQRQSVSSSLPVCESVFGGQLEQDSDPGLVLNCPSSHDSHGPPSGPVDPAAQ